MTKPRTKRLAALCVLAAATTAASASFAQGFTLDRFQPAPAGDRFFGVQGGDPGGELAPRLMLLGDYAYKPLVAYSDGGGNNEVGTVVSHQLVLHLAGTLALWNRLWISANMPLALVIDGQNQDVNGLQVSSPSGFAAGDLRAGLRLRLVGELDSLATLALAAYVYIPTGNKDKLAGDGEVHVLPALVLSGEDDNIAYAVNAGFNIRKQSIGDYPTAASELTFGGAFGFLLADKTVQLGPEIYGSTAMVGNDSFARATTNVEGLLGARMRLGQIVLGAGAGPGISRGAGTPTFRGVLSLAWVPLPEKPLPPPPPPPRKPQPPRDRDKDGIADAMDACPDEPGVKTDDPATNGCPPPPPDRDGDGILDRDDACPDLKGVKSDDPTQNGCPPDTDGDGIRDDVDACPHEKGKPNSDPTKNGCPTSVRVTENEIVILEQVQFKTGSAVILKASDDLLFQVAVVLSEHPEINKLEVQGHTDNRGGKKYNQKLSEKRAAAVMKWLVTRGSLDAGRLSSHGYGMDEPIAENDTPDGRQKNRRVQFKILDKSPSAGRSE
jgi:outer membrane protein OmpA-like peptidoglycan-associated protein